MSRDSNIVSLHRRRLERAIGAAVRASLNAPMRWGQDDCALWCADIIREALGFDPAHAFRGRYTTARGYRRVLRRAGLFSLDQALQAVAFERGWTCIWPKDAVTGDLGIVEVQEPGRRYQICVIRRGALWVGRRNYGCGVPPAGVVSSAWRVA